MDQNSPQWDTVSIDTNTNEINSSQTTKDKPSLLPIAIITLFTITLIATIILYVIFFTGK